MSFKRDVPMKCLNICVNIVIPILPNVINVIQIVAIIWVKYVLPVYNVIPAR